MSCRENDVLLWHKDTLGLFAGMGVVTPRSKSSPSATNFVLLCLERGHDEQWPQNSPRSLWTFPAAFTAWPFVLVWPTQRPLPLRHLTGRWTREPSPRGELDGWRPSALQLQSAPSAEVGSHPPYFPTLWLYSQRIPFRKNPPEAP